MIKSINLKSHFSRGFSVIEIVLAAALFIIFAIGAISLVLAGLDINRLGEEQTIANQYASEGIEAVRSIKNHAFANLLNSSGTGVARVSNLWAFSGSNNTFGKYTRVITVGDIQRDVNGNIVASGGTLDPLTKKITSTTSWNFSPTRANSVVLSTYLTDWKKPLVGNWANPSITSSLNLPTNGNGVKVFVSGNYAYIVRSTGTPNFVVVDVSNLLAPVVVGSLNVSGTPADIFVSGNYAYVASSDNAAELQIINVSTPTAPVAAGSFNAAGNGAGNGVYVVGTTVYLARFKQATNPNFYAIDASNPAAPISLGSIVLSADALDVFVMGSFAYVASSSNSTELNVINISTPASMTLVSTTNLAGNQNALSITGFTNRVLIGRVGGDVSAIDVTTPASPSIIGTINVGGDVNDISLGNSNNYAFLATGNNAAEFQVLNISSLSSMTLLGSLNMSATQYGVFYDSTRDRAFLVGAINTAEFAILQPN